MVYKLVYILCFSFIWSCQFDKKTNNTQTNFDIKGNIVENQGFEKVYLSYIVENNVIIIDSSKVKNDSFHFQGKTAYPIKSQLQFYTFGNYFPFILCGEKMEITLNAADLSQSKISGSSLNAEWNNLKLKSIEIYADIDYLFPLLQKARMQNDYETLAIISKKIDSIDILNRNYLINYVDKNPNSHLAALILNDLFKTAQNDSLIILQTAKKITPDFQKALEFELK